MIVKCPKCNSKGKVSGDYAGKEVRCPKCAVGFIAVEDSGRSEEWYYGQGQEKIGPIDRDQLLDLAHQEAFSASTLIWKKGMAGWQPFLEVFPELAMSAESITSADPEAIDEPLAEFHYAGASGRIAAWIIDVVFMLSLGGMVEGLSRKFFPGAYAAYTLNPVLLGTLGLNVFLGMFYTIFFVGKYGATPGKMLCRLQIVNQDGGAVSYRQAFGRYCGKFIFGALTLMLSFLPFFFDPQRRALHDRMSHTLVIEV